MHAVLQSSFGVLFSLLCLAVLVVGLRASRTRKFAIVGFFPGLYALSMFAWSFVAEDKTSPVRFGQSVGALAAGFAHVVVYSLVALPKKLVTWRIGLAMLGLWSGTFVAYWVLIPDPATWLQAVVAILVLATISSWAVIPFASRERGFVDVGAKRYPTVRFACPRCGTRVDWGQGVAACSDCGLFMHILWPADELQAKAAKAGHPDPDPSMTVRFPCPSCGTKADWPRGDDVCASCGLKLSIHWNVHPHKPVGVKKLEKS